MMMMMMMMLLLLLLLLMMMMMITVLNLTLKPLAVLFSNTFQLQYVRL